MKRVYSFATGFVIDGWVGRFVFVQAQGVPHGFNSV